MMGSRDGGGGAGGRTQRRRGIQGGSEGEEMGEEINLIQIRRVAVLGVGLQLQGRWCESRCDDNSKNAEWIRGRRLSLSSASGPR